MRRLSSRQVLRLEIQRQALKAWQRTRPAGQVDVVDLGTEFGDSGGIARDVLGYERATVCGCELWEPNGSKAGATGFYDEVFKDDARDFLGRPDESGRARTFDVAFCCEILEHMPHDDGEKTIQDMIGHLRPGGLILVTAPLGWMPQGPIDGNPHEVHVSAWDPVELEDLGFVTLAVLPEHRLFVSAYTTANVEWRA